LIFDMNRKNIVKISDYFWEIPKSFRADMRVPARFYASEKMLDDIFRDRSLEQLVNVSSLPKIKECALGMPDMHEGYGFPIGGVAAMEYPDGVISPGGIGYDINCGVRLLVSDKNFKEAKSRIENLACSLYKEIPSGVGKGGAVKLSPAQMDAVLEGGARWAVENGFGDKEDLNNIESGGVLDEADASLVSDHAKKRGMGQLGTMGAGNHFVEVDCVEKVFDKGRAEEFGLAKGRVVVLIHTGSRGLGHQIATDYIKTMVRSLAKHKIELPDIELACAPFNSREGRDYFRAMSAGANYAWANRQMITWHVRNVWKRIFGAESKLLLLYDVAHNLAKIEEYGGQKFIVHRKGATRAFPGQPVLIPGSMGTASYVLAGTREAMKKSFGSTCHGAGRRMSRHAALRQERGRDVRKELLQRGIVVESGSWKGLAEEAPFAYKDVDDVVGVVDGAGIARKVARLLPMAVIKG